ncbi:MAG: hypothetical protein S4CHLAM2_03900 [Chlamydiales bacterium]|nr:hypothetical protein [Chlamydiales bacterium]
MKNTSTLLTLLTLPIMGGAMTWGPPINLEGNASTLGLELDPALGLIVFGQNAQGLYQAEDFSPFTTFFIERERLIEPLEVTRSEGETVVAWIDKQEGHLVVKVTDGSEPFILSSPFSDTRLVRMTSGRAGEIWIVWQEEEAEHQVIKVAQYSKGTWGTGLTLSSVDRDASDPQIVANETGEVLVAWVVHDMSRNKRIQVSHYQHGLWSGIQTLSACGLHSRPAIALNQQGDAGIVWQHFNGEYNEVQGTCYRSGRWESPCVLSFCSDADHPCLAIDERGNTLAVWECFDSIHAIQSAHLTNGEWSAPHTISSFGQRPAVAFNLTGEALVLFQSLNRVHTTLFHRGRWDSPQSLSDPLEPAYDPKMLFLDRAYVAWTRDLDAEALVQVSVSVDPN